MRLFEAATRCTSPFGRLELNAQSAELTAFREEAAALHCEVSTEEQARRRLQAQLTEAWQTRAQQCDVDVLARDAEVLEALRAELRQQRQTEALTCRAQEFLRAEWNAARPLEVGREETWTASRTAVRESDDLAEFCNLAWSVRGMFQPQVAESTSGRARQRWQSTYRAHTLLSKFAKAFEVEPPITGESIDSLTPAPTVFIAMDLETTEFERALQNMNDEYAASGAMTMPDEMTDRLAEEAHGIDEEDWMIEFGSPAVFLKSTPGADLCQVTSHDRNVQGSQPRQGGAEVEFGPSAVHVTSTSRVDVEERMSADRRMQADQRGQDGGFYSDCEGVDITFASPAMLMSSTIRAESEQPISTDAYAHVGQFQWQNIGDIDHRPPGMRLESTCVELGQPILAATHSQAHRAKQEDFGIGRRPCVGAQMPCAEVGQLAPVDKQANAARGEIVIDPPAANLILAQLAEVKLTNLGEALVQTHQDEQYGSEIESRFPTMCLASSPELELSTATDKYARADQPRQHNAEGDVGSPTECSTTMPPLEPDPSISDDGYAQASQPDPRDTVMVSRRPTSSLTSCTDMRQPPSADTCTPQANQAEHEDIGCRGECLPALAPVLKHALSPPAVSHDLVGFSPSALAQVRALQRFRIDAEEEAPQPSVDKTAEVRMKAVHRAFEEHVAEAISGCQ